MLVFFMGWCVWDITPRKLGGMALAYSQRISAESGEALCATLFPPSRRLKARHGKACLLRKAYF